MNKDDLLVSLRRTLVPIIVGVLSATVLDGFVDLASLESVVSGLISAVYYGILRILEAKVPAVGMMLGARKMPTYIDTRI